LNGLWTNLACRLAFCGLFCYVGSDRFPKRDEWNSFAKDIVMYLFDLSYEFGLSAVVLGCNGIQGDIEVRAWIQMSQKS
jgi:hypothetical protein